MTWFGCPGNRLEMLTVPTRKPDLATFLNDSRWIGVFSSLSSMGEKGAELFIG